MALYVKAGFKPGLKFKYNGEEFEAELGVNAFKTLQEALQAATEGETIVLLDKSVTVKTDSLTQEVAMTVSGGTATEETQTSQATLTMTGTLDDSPLELSSVDFNLFKSVKIVNALTGNITGGDITDSEKNTGNNTGKWVNEYKSVGKAQIDDDSVVNGNITGFKDVVLNDNAEVTGYIAAMTLDDGTHVGSYKEDESSTIKYSEDPSAKISGTYSQILTTKAAGSAKITESTVTEGIYGYSTVTVSDDESSVSGLVDRGENSVKTYKATYATKNDTVSKVEEKSTVNTASGAFTATAGNISADIKNYNTVTLTNTGVGNIMQNMLVKDSTKKTYNVGGTEKGWNDYSALWEGKENIWNATDADPEYELTAEDNTFQSKASGKVTLKIDTKAAADEMKVGSISGYANVTATGYAKKDVEKGIILGSIYGGEVKETDKVQNGTGKWVDEYKASGSVKLKTKIEVSGDIVGYNTVDLSDDVTVGTVQAAGDKMLEQHYIDVLGGYVYGSYKEEISDGVKWTDTKVSGSDSMITTYKAAASFKASDNVTVKNIIGYEKVSLDKNSTVEAGIERGNNSVTSSKITYTGNSSKVTMIEDHSIVYNASGSLTATDSTIEGDVNNYKTVSLTNTSAGNIQCTMQTKDTSKKSYLFYSISEALKDYQQYNGSSAGTLAAEDTVFESKTAGSLTVKINPKSAAAGNIEIAGVSGYANITATGYDGGEDGFGIKFGSGFLGGEVKETDKEQNGTSKWVDEYKASGSVKLKTKIEVSGDIVGYNTVDLSDSVTVGTVQAAGKAMLAGHYNFDISELPEEFAYLPDVFGSYKEDVSQNVKISSGKITGTNSNVVTIKAASSFKAADEVTVKGNIYGYATVTLKDQTTVEKSIVRGQDAVITNKQTYSTTKGIVNRVDEDTTVYNASGTLTATDSSVSENVIDYKTVTLTNTSVFGAITRDMSAKISYKTTSELGDFDFVSDQDQDQDIDSIEGTPISYEEVFESKAAGSVTLKINNKLEPVEMSVGDVSGYANVTATGYSNKKMEFISSITIGSEYGGITGGEYKYTYKNGNAKIENKASGSVKLTTNINVNGNIDGYSTVTLSDSVTVFGGISGGNITQDYASGKQIYTATGKVTLTGNVSVGGNITGFKDISAKDAEISGSIIGGNGETSLRLRAVAQLGTAVGSLSFTEVKLGNEESEGLSIEGYKTVKITQSDVFANINCWGAKGSSVALDNSEISGSVLGAQQVSVKNEASIAGYIGTDYDDTFTVAAKAVLEITTDDLDFGYGKDKFVVEGTVLLYEYVDFNSIGLESMTGKGCIAVTTENYDPSNMLVGSKVEWLILGETIEGFQGKAAELADNTKAVVADWDVEEDEYGQLYYEYEGWLGIGDDLSFEDECDLIKFKADRGGMLNFDGLGENDIITVNGEQLAYGAAYEVSAGMDYLVSITRVEENSTHYSMILA